MEHAGLTKSLSLNRIRGSNILDDRDRHGGLASGIDWTCRSGAVLEVWTELERRYRGRDGATISRGKRQPNEGAGGLSAGGTTVDSVSFSSFPLPCRHGRSRNYGRTRVEPYVEGGVWFWVRVNHQVATAPTANTPTTELQNQAFLYIGLDSDSTGGAA